MEEVIEKTEQNDNKGYIRDAFLSISSNLVNLACLWLMTLLLPKLLNNNFEASGIFTICMSISNISSAFAVYNISVYFTSDTSNKYREQHYFAFTITTSLISFLITIGLCIFYGYSAEIFVCVVLYYTFEFFGNFGTIFKAALVRVKKMRYFCYYVFAKAFLMLGIFALSLYLSQSLLIALIFLAGFGAISFVFTLLLTKHFCPNIVFLTPEVFKQAMKLFILAFPVFITGMVYSVIPSLPRLVYQNISQDTTMLGYFGIMSSITVLISAATTAMAIPFVPRLREAYVNKDGKGLSKVVLGLISFITIITLIAFFMVVFLGDWALGLVYGEEIVKHSDIFKWIVLATGIQSIVVILVDTITAMRKLTHLTIVSVSGMVITLSIMYPLTKYFGTYGIVYVYYISFGTILIALSTIICYYILKLRNNTEVIHNNEQQQ